MTAHSVLLCDAPGCTQRSITANVFSPGNTGTQRTDAKRDGWTSTRVPNPFYSGTRWSPKTVVLDRCPNHDKARLRMVAVDETTYRIEERQ